MYNYYSHLLTLSPFTPPFLDVKEQKKGAAAAAAAARNDADATRAIGAAAAAERAAAAAERDAAAAAERLYAPMTRVNRKASAAATAAEANAMRTVDVAAAAENAADAKSAAGGAAAAAKNDSAVPVSQQMTMLIIHPYEAQEDNHINLVAGEYIYGVEMGDDGWCRGTTMDGKTGRFPADCVTGRSDS